MPYRVSFFHQVQSTLLAGWSFNLFNSAGNVPAARTKALALVPLLDAVEAQQVFIPQIRISDVATFRNVLNEVNTGSVPGTPTPGRDADYPTTCLLLKFTASGNYSVRTWLRGIPDAIISSAGRYIPTPSFVTKINQLFAALTNGANTWCLNVLDRSVLPKVITDITQTGVVTCPTHGYADQSKIRIKGTKGMRVANALWRITVIDSNHFSLNHWVQPAVAVPATGNPTARLQSYIQVQISGAEVLRASKHDTGRPIGQLSGRRRRRAS